MTMLRLISTVLGCRLAPIAAASGVLFLPACSGSHVLQTPGVYVSFQSGGYLELRSDGGFFLDERGTGSGISGTYMISNDILTLTLPSGTATRATLTGDTIIDKDGERWLKYGATLQEAQARVLQEAQARAQAGIKDADIASLKADLRMLAERQDEHFKTHGRYTTDLSALHLSVNSHTTTVTVLAATPSGWSARATYLDRTRCSIYFGDGAGAPVVGKAGEYSCR